MTTRKINPRLIQRVVEMTTRQKPANVTHWSTRTMAQATGISEASVRRIWRAHGIQAGQHFGEGQAPHPASAF